MKGADSELKKRALAALHADERLDAARLRLDVDGKDGMVTLTGLVPHPWQKFYAQWVLERVPGIRQVANLILVDAVPRRTDEEIAQALLRSYVEDPYLDERAIQVEVEEGIVYLRGRVPSLLRKRLASVLAWWCPGVRDVINDLEVEYPEPNDNAYLADAIKAVLEKDPLVDGSAVAVHVTGDHNVTLTGAACSPEQRRAAENDVWCVPGVRYVENRLIITPPEVPHQRLGPGR